MKTNNSPLLRKSRKSPQTILKALLVKTFLFLTMYVNSQSYYQYEKINYVSFTARTGVNFSNLASPYEKGANCMGYQGGVILNYGLNSTFLQTGIEFGKKVYDTPFEEGSYIGRIYFVQIPLNIAHRINLSKSSRLILHGGPFINYGFGGSFKEPDGNIDPDVFSSKYGYIRFDYGLGVGASLEIKNIVLDLNYNAGIVNIDEYQNNVSKSHTISMMFGYKL